MLWSLVQLGIVFGIPAAVLLSEKHVKAIQVITPVLLCYLVGLLLGNQYLLVFDEKQSLMVSNMMVALAIPLMLFSVDLIGWLRLARSTVLSFFLCVVSAFTAAFFATLLFGQVFADSPKVAGMLVGVYIGGTPNMAAVGTALNVEPETFMKLNAADMIWSTVYLVFLLTVAKKLYAKILPPFPKSKDTDNDDVQEEAKKLPPLLTLIKGVSISAAIVGASYLIGSLCPEAYREAVMILLITTLSLGASMIKRLRALPGTSQSGYYFLLVFCVAIGTTAHFDQLLSSSLSIFFLTGAILVATVLIHLVLATIFRIDRDTVIITSTAAIWSPAIIPPVAMALRNKEIVVSGIASGLVGFAVGNYVGLALAWLVM